MHFRRFGCHAYISLAKGTGVVDGERDDIPTWFFLSHYFFSSFGDVERVVVCTLRLKVLGVRFYFSSEP